MHQANERVAPAGFFTDKIIGMKNQINHHA
jgi:hypothetical protein